MLHTWPDELVRMKRYTQFPIFDTAEEAVAALQYGRDRWQFRSKAPKRTPKARVGKDAVALLDGAEPGSFLRQDKAFALLDAFSIPHPPVAFAASARQAVAAAQGWKQPVAMKVESPDAVHKTEVNGIALSLETPTQIRAAYAQIETNLREKAPGARFDGVLVMPMAERGLEVIVGAKHDPSFGPVVLLGWGGTAAEALQAVSLRLAPVTEWEARQMIAELPGQKLLDCFRGRAAIDHKALARLIVQVGRLAHTPGVSEIDLNPVRLYADGVQVLDARVMAG